MADFKKVLLLGDYSGCHATLASGLRGLGIDVDIVSKGDGFKKLARDITLPDNKKFKKILFYKEFLKQLHQYDLVQVVGDMTLASQPVISCFLARAIAKKRPLFYFAAGCDYRFWTVGREKLKIPLFEEVERHNERRSNWFSDRVRLKGLLRYVQGVIGFNEYYEAYCDYPKCLGNSLLAFDSGSVTDSSQQLRWDGKLLILHGRQKGREGFKGSPSIEKAFDWLNQKYPGVIQCQTVEGLSYEEYRKELERCHILVDQTNATSYGMNALLGMAMGKVVCSNSQASPYYENWLNSVGISEEPPIVSITPDAQFIAQQIESLIGDRNYGKELSKRGPEFVQKYHSPQRVAERFISLWEKALKGS